jgi:ribonuclease PH
VQVVIYGPREPKSRSNSHPDKAVISVEVGVVPWAQSGGAKKSRGDRYVHSSADITLKYNGWTEADL